MHSARYPINFHNEKTLWIFLIFSLFQEKMFEERNCFKNSEESFIFLIFSFIIKDCFDKVNAFRNKVKNKREVALYF